MRTARVAREVRVLLVVDDAVVREHFTALLTSTDGVTVVGSVGDGQQALDAVEAVGADHVDVVVMDVHLPVLCGVEATRRLVTERPDVGVLVLTESEEHPSVLDAISAGARGYLHKDADPVEVRRAARRASVGGVVLGAALASRVADRLASVPGSSAGGLFPMLTARELEVLDLVGAGLPNLVIAQRLRLSPKTVRNRVSAVRTKLQAASRAEVVARAREAGMGRHTRAGCR